MCVGKSFFPSYEKSRASEHQALLAFKIDDLRRRGRLDAETGEAAAFREISREVGKGKGEAGADRSASRCQSNLGFVAGH